VNFKASRVAIDAYMPARDGLSDKTWSNIRSTAMSALQWCGVTEQYRPDPRDLAPEWLAFRNGAIGIAPYRFHRLSPFVHHCSRLGLSLREVDDAAVQSHMDVRAASLRHFDRKKYHRSLCATWNRVANALPSFSAPLLTVPSYSNTFSSNFSVYPESFEASFANWADIMRGNQPFAAEAPDRAMREPTITGWRHAILRVAAAAVHMGIPRNRITSLSSLCLPTVFRPAFEFLIKRAGGRPTATIANTAWVIYKIAEKGNRGDATAIKELRQISKRFRCRPNGLTDKNRERLRPFDDLLHVIRIITLPDLLEEAARKARNPRQRLQLMRTAVAIAILLALPIRLANLRSLELGRHIVRTRQGRSGIVHLVLEAREVKNSMPLDFEVPHDVVARIERYVKLRKALLGVETKLLFVGRTNSKPTALSDQIVAAIRRFTGFKMNVHLFRHLAAKLYLDRKPGDYTTISRVLGHKNLQTTMSFYSGFETAAAARYFHAVVHAPLNPRDSRSRKL
jgi:integrase